ncbi:hypothetical protein E5Q_03029 [Mixia osmundae IAM 14324]|uniref:OTU domain-containing protein n=1 Tax=Mixia osmundae (strain CBS 9802 / IAM 14324 / JCM 22182 / KY 12970) TaxID=764103 RepID=G7E0K3_MIXOS|nr:hypothetical protein E5Q_03029 [Mixia osmundae IAM 14324]
MTVATISPEQALKAHEANKETLHQLAKDVAGLSPNSTPSANSSSPKDSPHHHHHHHHHSISPTSIANALLSRKPKSKSSSKKKSCKTPTPAVLAQEVEIVEKDEMALISSGSLAQAEQADQGEILDLADRLLAQLGEDESPGSDVRETPTSVDAVPVPGAASTAPPERASSSGSRLNALLHSGDQSHKPSRAALRKERKAGNFQKIKDEAQKELDAKAGIDPAEDERQEMDKICASAQLEMFEMPPDGHCLYNAIADQLQVTGLVKSRIDYTTTRHEAAKFMRTHADMFLPFITTPEGDDEELLSPEQYRTYCDNIENTSEWGGQPEIMALSQSYKCPVYIYQAHSPIVKIGEDGLPDAQPLRISYHKSMYGLGVAKRCRTTQYLACSWRHIDLRGA